MSEKRNDQYVDLFERCAEWLEKNHYVAQAIGWVRQYKPIAIAAVVLLLLLSLVLIMQRASGIKAKEATAATQAHQELQKQMTLLSNQVKDMETWQKEWIDRLQKANQKLLDLESQLLQAQALAKESQLVAKELGLKISKSSEEAIQNLQQAVKQIQTDQGMAAKQLEIMKQAVYQGKVALLAPGINATLPPLTINHASGSLFGSPVVLKTGCTEAIPASAQIYLALEQFSAGEYKFLRETMSGPLTLPEGLYRARAFLRDQEGKGPESEAVAFRVDTTPPTGNVVLTQDKQLLTWQIEISEDKIAAWCSVEWEGGFLTLKTPGKTGSCELPANCTQATVRVVLRDEAGNESVITQVWGGGK